jgi:type I restriction enzyme S subunit
MKSNYKPLGNYIQPVDERNSGLEDLPLMGLSVSKVFFPTIANLVGTDMKTYKIVYRNQFTYIADTSRRGDKIAISLNEKFDKMLVSQAYTPFEVKDFNELDPEYLMMWFRRPEFDRYARFKSHGSAREIFDWEEMCNTLLPIPSINKQREIVKEYNVIQNRIALNQQLIKKLEETAQAIYRAWFVEGENEDEYITIGDLFTPKKGKNITRENAIEGIYPVVAGGLEPSCYHNDYNTKSPIVTISASGANAGFVRLYHSNVWAADCSFIDKNVFDNVFFAYVSLKVNQALLMSKQEGTGQPHIYPEHIITIPVYGFSEPKLKAFDKYCKEIFERVAIAEKENHKLTELKELLLSKLTTIEN